MNQIIQFDKISFKYENGNTVLDNISLTICQDEKIALVGLNGSGKTTLLLHTNGLLLPVEGSVKVDGETITKKSRVDAAFKVGMLFQNPDDQLFMPTLEEDVAFGPRNMKLSEEEIKRRVEIALITTGMERFRSKAPYQLSGGEKRMGALATILSMKPEILVLDEPTSELDYLGRQKFIDTMLSLPTAIIMSTHDLDLARTLCRRAVILDKGRIVYDGPVENMPYPD